MGGGDGDGEEGQTPRADQVLGSSITLSLCCFLCHCEPPCVPCPTYDTLCSCFQCHINNREIGIYRCRKNKLIRQLKLLEVEEKESCGRASQK